MTKLIILFISLSFTGCVNSQRVWAVGDSVPDVPAERVLNSKAPLNSLHQLAGSWKIIDFFGTWCVPCIRALPVLDSLKQAYPDLSILLVSTESTKKLNEFLVRRKNIEHPIWVDSSESLSSFFKPPAYPYTILLNEENKIVQIASNIEISTDLFKEWIRKPVPPIENINKPMELSVNDKKPDTYKAVMVQNTILKLSQDLIYGARTRTDIQGLFTQLEQLPQQALLDSLKTDDEKKTFWINLYNAWVNYSLHKNPGAYQNRNHFFKARNIAVAGTKMSLDDIEHGVLRKSQVKWGLGYLRKWFPKKWEKSLRVDRVDYRIHFALNCGAASCPPIAYYKSESIEAQLEQATQVYLTSEVEYDAGTNTLKLPVLMSWFRGDFGGKRKSVEMLKARKIIENVSKPRIRFKKYNWSIYLDNFKD